MPRSLALAYAQPRKGVVRAGNGRYFQLAMARAEPEGDSAGPGRCVIIIRSQDNPEGRIPKWLQNMGAKKVRRLTPFRHSLARSRLLFSL